MEDTSKGFIVSGEAAGMVYLRFVVCNHSTTEEHILEFYHFLIHCSLQL